MPKYLVVATRAYYFKRTHARRGTRYSFLRADVDHCLGLSPDATVPFESIGEFNRIRRESDRIVVADAHKGTRRITSYPVPESLFPTIRPRMRELGLPKLFQFLAGGESAETMIVAYSISAKELVVECEGGEASRARKSKQRFRNRR